MLYKLSARQLDPWVHLYFLSAFLSGLCFKLVKWNCLRDMVRKFFKAAYSRRHLPNVSIDVAPCFMKSMFDHSHLQNKETTNMKNNQYNFHQQE
jgi:hypothetical protein